MTDNEIKKALECCRTNLIDDCKRCSLRLEDGTTRPFCTTILIGNALDLINRLQAENERLQGDIEWYRGTGCKPMSCKPPKDPLDFCGVLCAYAEGLVAKAKAEAYKEFFQLIHKEFVDISNGYFESKNIDACVVMQGAIDKLRETYKEKEGEDNA